MNIGLEVALTQGEFKLAVEFQTDAMTIGIVGPSGSGKTTLLNVIAGMAQPEHGYVEVSGRVLVDTGRRIAIPPYRRNIGYVFQDGRLFPHLTVQQNLNYGHWFSRGREGLLGRERVVELLAIGHLLHRRAVGLSGGEQQRVAIGRALFASPRLLLMDEPLAGLDPGRREEILPMIARMRNESRIPLIYVSHAEGEIRYLADEIITLEGGRLADRRPVPTKHTGQTGFEGDPQAASSGSKPLSVATSRAT